MPSRRAARLTPALLDALADTVAAYHQTPAAGRRRRLPPMRDIARGNAPSRERGPAGRRGRRSLAHAMLAALRTFRAVARPRARRGFVRRAHGDLHLGNLCLWQGRPVPFDAMEFDEALATIDLGYDLAFLLMDLDHRVARAAANRVLNRYVARTGDAGLDGGAAGLPVDARHDPRACRGQPRPRRRWQRLSGPGARVPRPRRRSWSRSVACPGPASPPWPARSHRVWAPRRARWSCAATRSASASMAWRRSSGCRESAYTAAAQRGGVRGAGGLGGRRRRSGQCVIADAMFFDPPIARRREAAAQAAGARFLGFWLNAPRAVWRRGGHAAAATPPTPRSRCCERRSGASPAAATGMHSTSRRRRTTWPWRDRRW